MKVNMIEKRVLAGLIVSLLILGCSVPKINNSSFSKTPSVAYSLRRPPKNLTSDILVLKPISQNLKKENFTESQRNQGIVEIPAKEISATENSRLGASRIVSSKKEVYIPQSYLSRFYLKPALDFLEEAGYSLSLNRKSPLRLKIVIRFLRGGRFSGYCRRGYSRIGMRLRNYAYVCDVCLIDNQGQVVGRGEGVGASHNINLRLPASKRSFLGSTFDFYGNRDKAKTEAVLNAMADLVRNCQKKAIF